MTKKDLFFAITALLLLAVLPWIAAGCGGTAGGGGGSTVGLGGSGSGNGAEAVGSSVCLTCHSGTSSNQYTAGDTTDNSTSSPTYYDSAANAGIGPNYVASVHYTPPNSTSTDFVTCEGCHGGGSQHYGTGPIPNYAPGISTCGSCHEGYGFNLTEFNATSHANPNGSPDKYFGQGRVGTDQASIGTGSDPTANASPEYKSDGTTPVSKNEHIEECSACHNYSTKAAHISGDDVPNPPTVRCASCHDPHIPSAITRNNVGTRNDATGLKGAVAAPKNVNMKPQRVNNDSSASMYGAKNLGSGTWIRPRTYYEYQVGGDANRIYEGYAKQNTAGDWLRLSPERLCASCHTKGQYKYGAYAGSTALTGTHNKDIFTQYRNSGHGNTDGLVFKKFSLKADPVADASYRPQYPYDMGKTDGGKSVGLHNGSANFYSCGQCKNGMASIAWQKGTHGGLANTQDPITWVNYFSNNNKPPNGWGDTYSSPVLWGDASVTCITCHDPHSNGTGVSTNIRIPQNMSYNSSFQTGVGAPFQDYAPPGSTTPNVRGAANKMMDLTDIPSGAGTSIICIFCHQGRESGWTVWNKIRITRQYLIADPKDDATTAMNFMYNQGDSKIDPAGFSILNSHYYEGAALLWSKNAYEFGGKKYSTGNSTHQEKNCTGCHMDTANSTGSAGGHTFKPQLSTCLKCHGLDVNNFQSVMASSDYNANGVVERVFSELGEVKIIIQNTPQAGIYGSGTGGSGLVGLLNEALYEKGIRYNPDSYPYFFRWNAGSSYSQWTPNELGAAFNLQFLWKTGNAIYVHNSKYTVQLLIDSLAALGKTTNPSTGNAFATNRPSGNRDDTDYRTLKP